MVSSVMFIAIFNSDAKKNGKVNWENNEINKRYDNKIVIRIGHDMLINQSIK